MPLFVLVLAAAGVFTLSIFTLRGLLDIRDALRFAELTRLTSPLHWRATRAGLGFMAGMPVSIVTSRIGAAAWLAGFAVAALGYWVAPQFLIAARERAGREVSQDLALHLDLIALAMEAGGSLPAALAACAERAPEGALRRAWMRVILEIHAGAEPLEALRGLEQRVNVQALSSLVSALRSAERFGIELAPVFRERARQAAAHRYAQAERLARAAPLKLWATLVLCLAPCTLVVLAFPVAHLLALAAGN